MALVGEPSELSLVTRHKGLMIGELILRTRGLYRPAEAGWVYEVTFEGRAAHSSTPHLGRNAIEDSLRFLRSLEKRVGKVVVLSWQGGTGHNIIPASAELRLSLGNRAKVLLPSEASQRVRVKRLDPGWYPTLPWEEIDWCIEALRALLAPQERVREPAFQPPHLTWNVTGLKETKEGWCMTFDVRTLPGR
jgi:acetylornithine deacetylase/succinyl-diaminopimelate desuccinylase-like protein